MAGSRQIEVEYTGDASDLERASKQAEDSVGRVDKSTRDMGETFDDTGSKSSQLAGGLGDLGGALSQMGGPLGGLGAGMELAAPLIMGVTGAMDLLSVGSTLAAGATRVLSLALAALPFIAIGLAIAAFVAGIIWAYNNVTWFHDLVVAAWQGVQAVILAVWAVIRPIFDLIVNYIKIQVDAYLFLWDIAKQVFGAVAGVIADAAGAIGRWAGIIGGYIGDVVRFITGIPGAIANVASELFNKGKEIAQNFYDGFKSIIANAGDTFVSGLKSALNTIIVAPMNTVIGLINTAIRAYNRIPFATNIPEIAEIPRLASGGIVNRPTLALIGEAGPEAVVPLRGRAAEAAGLGSVHITINVPPTANPAETGRAVAGALRSYFAAGGRLAVPV